MRISLNPNLIFIHVPKTGGVSVGASLPCNWDEGDNKFKIGNKVVTFNGKTDMHLDALSIRKRLGAKNGGIFLNLPS